MKRSFLLLALIASSAVLFAQNEEEETKPGFKENLFTGGSISLSFFNNTFLIGGSPVFGYSLSNWADAGIVVNYNYTSYRDYNYGFNDKLRQTVYGGGAFVKLYPLRFLFAQAQFEHNFIRQKFIPNSGATQTYSTSGNSVLVGGGYTTGRQGKGGQPFYYLAVLFDVSGNDNSPYTDAYGRTIPIIRGGIQVPLFQGDQWRR
ncbi:MAG: hypothetical protein IPK57_08795 [Chitinophagaceae bacterium]|nr:hypothetical protein [Chitinophagaceae bacterium]